MNCLKFFPCIIRPAVVRKQSLDATQLVVVVHQFTRKTNTTCSSLWWVVKNDS